MRAAAATAISTPVELALIVSVPRAELERAVPIGLEPLDPFAEPEPSHGATIELASGRHVVIIYGDITGRLSVHALSVDADDAIDDFLAETGLGRSAVLWRNPSRVSPGRA